MGLTLPNPRVRRTEDQIESQMENGVGKPCKNPEGRTAHRRTANAAVGNAAPACPRGLVFTGAAKFPILAVVQMAFWRPGGALRCSTVP